MVDLAVFWEEFPLFMACGSMAIYNRMRGTSVYVLEHEKRGLFDIPVGSRLNSDLKRYKAIRWYTWDPVTYILMGAVLMALHSTMDWVQIAWGFVFGYVVLHTGWGLYFPTGRKDTGHRSWKKQPHKMIRWVVDTFYKNYFHLSNEKEIRRWQTIAMSLRMGVASMIFAALYFFSVGESVAWIAGAGFLAGLVYTVCFKLTRKYKVQLSELVMGALFGAAFYLTLGV